MFRYTIQGGGELTKNHRKASPPHEASTKFDCSHQMILPSPSTSKNPLKSPQKESNYLSITTFSGRLVKVHPFFLDFTLQVQLVKYTLKTWKMAEPIGGFWSSAPWVQC